MVFVVGNSRNPGVGATMGRDREQGRRRRDFEERSEEFDESSSRPRVDPDEQDEYEEWRRERAKRGRKRKDKAGGRHRRRDEDDF